MHMHKSLPFYLILSFFAAATWQFWLVWQLDFFALSADESAHTLEAYAWYRTGELKATTWLPFHRIVVGWLFHIWPDLFYLPRLLSFAFGWLALVAVAWLAFELFGRRVAIIALCLGVFLPQRVVLGVLPLMEMPFICAITFGAAALARWERDGLRADARMLGVAAGCWGVASSIRYEGWLFAGGLFLMLCWWRVRGQVKVSFARFVLVSLLLLAFPLFWMVFHFQTHGHPLWFAQGVANRYALLYGNQWRYIRQHNVLSQFIAQNIYSFNIWGLYVLAQQLDKKRIQRWSTVPLLSFVLMSLLSLTGRALPTHNFWRIAAVWSLLLLPFTSAWLHNQLFARYEHTFYLRRWLLISMPSLFFLLAFALQTHTLVNSSFTPFTSQHRDMGTALAEELASTPPSHILIEQTLRWDQLHIVVASNHPDAFVYHSNPSSNAADVRGVYINPQTGEIDHAKLDASQIDYLLFKSETFKQLLAQDQELRVVQTFGRWVLYRR